MSVPRIAAVAAALFACSHAPPPAPPAAQETAPPPARPPPAPPATPAKPVEAAQPVQARAQLYFAFDSWALSPEARNTLQSFFDAMQKRADLHVRIEGNCDERGTGEYNLALGQRRAEAAKKYLVNLGLAGSRITAISNGKEKPRNPGHDEAAWQENRRDDLLPSNNTVGRL